MRNDKLNALLPCMSCTYWEAILRVKPFWDGGNKLAYEQSLRIIFGKSIEVIRRDLERGTP